MGGQENLQSRCERAEQISRINPRREKIQQDGQFERRERGSREISKVINRFRGNLRLTHFTGISESTVEIDEAVNQSLKWQVWRGRRGIGRSRERVRRLGCHGREKPCKDFPAGVPFSPSIG